MLWLSCEGFADLGVPVPETVLFFAIFDGEDAIVEVG
jgi:hypothetical protein